MNDSKPNKPLRHLQTPEDFAREFRSPDVQIILSDLGRQATVEAHSSVSIQKKTLGVMVVLVRRIEKLEREIEAMKKVKV